MTKTARVAQEFAPGLSPEQTSQCHMAWAYISPPKYNQAMPKSAAKNIHTSSMQQGEKPRHATDAAIKMKRVAKLLFISPQK